MRRIMRNLLGASIMMGLAWSIQPTMSANEWESCADLSEFCTEYSDGACYGGVVPPCAGTDPVVCEFWCFGCSWHTLCEIRP